VFRSEPVPVGGDDLLGRFGGLAEEEPVPPQSCESGVRTVERLAIPRIPILVTGKRPIVRFDPAQVKAWVDAKRTRALGTLPPAAPARAAGGAR